jgi:phospholipid transport system substrate-binding protein
MIRALFALLTALHLGIAAAQGLPPDVLARRTTDEVLAVLRANPDLSRDSGKVYELVQTKILPHFDFARMTRLAVGPAWRQASAAQQKALTDEFRALLVYTYANSLVAYRDQTVHYRPLQMKSGDSEVLVRSSIRQPGAGEPVDVNYSMEKTDDVWKVYDVTIAGVSIVQNYRSNFASLIQKAGIDGLIASLAAKNKSLARSDSPQP